MTYNKLTHSTNVFIHNLYDTYKGIMANSPINGKNELNIIENFVSNFYNSNYYKLKYIVVIGVGGAVSALSAIVEFSKYIHGANPKKIKVYFCNYLDKHALNNLYNKIKLDKTLFLVISNSGETLETLAILHYWKHLLILYKLNLKQHLIFITSSSYNKLYQSALDIDCKVFFYPTKVVGRFAIFSVVNTLVGTFLNLNMREFCDGGNKVMKCLEFNLSMYEGFYKNKNISFEDFQKNVIKRHIAYNNITNNIFQFLKYYYSGHHIIINISYSFYFSKLLLWYSQFIAESLGKSSLNISTISSFMPHEQHSQLQAFLNGENDKIFTCINLNDNLYKGVLLDNKMNSANYICKRKMLKYLKNKINPVRNINIKPTMASLGCFMMNAMLETCIVGERLGINPYDQQDIDNLKKELSQYCGSILL